MPVTRFVKDSPRDSGVADIWWQKFTLVLM